MLDDKNIQNLLRHVKTELNKAIARGDDRSAIEWREAQIKIGKAINHGRAATHVRVQHTRVIGQCQSCVLDATLLASSVTLH